MANALATPADLAVWLQHTVTADQANLALETATGWIQAELRQTILRVDNDTVTFRGGQTSLWLPELPVISVGAVTTTTDKGVTTARVLNTNYRVIGNELRWGSTGSGYWPELVTVTYSHGYGDADIPGALRAVCLSAAARACENATSLRSETVGGVSWTAAGGVEDLGPGLTAGERSALDPFRQLVVA